MPAKTPSLGLVSSSFPSAHRIAIATLLVALAGASGCREAPEQNLNLPPAVESTGGKSGTGGRTGSGGSKGTGGAAMAGTGGSPTDAVAPADVGATDAVADAPVSMPETGGAADAKADVISGPETAPGKVAVCWPDSKVIKICHQLENACENCPPGGAPPQNATATTCFALIKKAYAGMATDEECAKFAVDHKCTVDNVKTTGNVCGSLNCNQPTCKDKARCLNRQQEGDSSMCTQFLATCPCS